MDNQKNIHHHSGHAITRFYPVSLWPRIHSAFTPLVLLVVLFLILQIFSIVPPLSTATISPTYEVAALFYTLLRLLVAFVFALIISIPLAIFVEKNQFTERIFLPIFDILQSVPILAFFPILIILFIKSNLLNIAAIVIIFITMLWNIVFCLVGGLKLIPNEIKSAAQVFNIRGFSFFKKITLPALVPTLVMGSLLAWAQAWNMIIVAEVLHTYIPGGTASQDLFGLGSVLVNSSANGQVGKFFATLFLMVGIIAIINFFVWQKLLHYAERFKFD